jgi:hypothetical protein
VISSNTPSDAVTGTRISSGLFSARNFRTDGSLSSLSSLTELDHDEDWVMTEHEPQGGSDIGNDEGNVTKMLEGHVMSDPRMLDGSDHALLASSEDSVIDEDVLPQVTTVSNDLTQEATLLDFSLPAHFLANDEHEDLLYNQLQYLSGRLEMVQEDTMRSRIANETNLALELLMDEWLEETERQDRVFVSQIAQMEEAIESVYSAHLGGQHRKRTRASCGDIMSTGCSDS